MLTANVSRANELEARDVQNNNKNNNIFDKINLYLFFFIYIFF